MKNFKWIYFFIIIFSNLTAFSANAFLVLTYKEPQIDFDKPTRILITGVGKEQGTQFQEVANTKAIKYSDLYPNEQIVLIAKNENKYFARQRLLQKFGFILQSEKRSLFNGDNLIETLTNFKNITSIDIFSHGTAQYGLYLESTQDRLSVETTSIKNLQGHFAPDAYIFLHGCNTGFYLAPHLSNILNIPVAGSLTSSDFQRLHSDGSFYLTQEDYYPNSDWARANRVTFNAPTNCQDGKCIRLKPDNHPYYGYWGEYKGGGLPFYKFFCVNNSTRDCERVMAKSLYSFIGTNNLKLNSTLKEYKNLLGDFLCPISGTRDYRRNCRERLDLALLTRDGTFNPFRGNLLDCDFKSCKSEFRCKSMRRPTLKNGKYCSLVNNSNSPATTFVREYEAYMAGIHQLKAKKNN